MTDTQWPDISSYQPYLGSIPYRAVAIRSKDGTYRDSHFARNLAQCKKAVAAGELDFFLVYLVFETNWSETFATFRSMVGAPHPRMAVMIDVESWGGKIRGDHSSQINALRSAIAQWIGNPQRVGVYANGGDLAALYPQHAGLPWFVLANYSANPTYPVHFAHQYSDRVYVPGLGSVDMNSADGYTVADCMKVLGVAPAPKPPPKPTPTPTPTPAPTSEDEDMPLIVQVDKNDCAPVKKDGPAWPGDWLLAGGLYRHILKGSDVAALVKAGAKTVVISLATHNSLVS